MNSEISLWAGHSLAGDIEVRWALDYIAGGEPDGKGDPALRMVLLILAWSRGPRTSTALSAARAAWGSVCWAPSQQRLGLIMQRPQSQSPSPRQTQESFQLSISTVVRCRVKARFVIWVKAKCMAKAWEKAVVVVKRDIDITDKVMEQILVLSIENSIPGLERHTQINPEHADGARQGNGKGDGRRRDENKASDAQFHSAYHADEVFWVPNFPQGCDHLERSRRQYETAPADSVVVHPASVVMSSSRDALRRQRRRELDARRSKSRVRLGACLQSWGQLKESLGFLLLQSTLEDDERARVMATSGASLHRLVLLVHDHGQQCPYPPALKPYTPLEDHIVCGGRLVEKGARQKGARRRGLRNSKKHTQPDVSSQEKELAQPSEGSKSNLELWYTCKGGHSFSWCPCQDVREGDNNGVVQGELLPDDAVGSGEPGRKGSKGTKTELDKEEVQPAEDTGSRPCDEGLLTSEGGGQLEEEEMVLRAPETEEDRLEEGFAQAMESDAISDVLLADPTQPQESWQPSDSEEKDLDCVEDKSYSTVSKKKATPRDILPCEFDGCGKIFSTRQYLNHHMKYQHFQQKTFSCSHPACGKSFNFKKHLKEHEKLHSNQRDYICEFCARAFRTSSNLIIHRRIHTGEKPLQCEVCGFTCRQKASLNWHMRKHDAESGYQFPCEICGRRFEKRDNVTAHRSKSHPDQSISSAPVADSDCAATTVDSLTPITDSSGLVLGSMESRGYITS
ncbi:zinc finger protein 692-like [Scleropages formosus]|uniref:Zinc finger protein 692-like n=1 Tax=Scleropages formosus TaxID=113540 RepID=A0A0P7X6J1_SCLFO|nr:zinc finger protein 692-like [Scleropages formosus]